jgi:S1-C subfamily serine protease
VLTNHHVVERCQRLRVQANGDAAPARVLARDREVDLALLASELPAAENGAEFRSSDRVRLGEPVIVAGFPLHDILSTDLHVFPGIVSALAGPGDDARLLQISAPVQPGNSGGPLLDDSGQVIGVVLGQLSTGVVGRNRIPQNVNFAIRGTLARSFLERQGVRFHSPRSDPRLSTVEIAARARAFTVLVECLQ